MRAQIAAAKTAKGHGQSMMETGASVEDADALMEDLRLEIAELQEQLQASQATADEYLEALDASIPTVDRLEALVAEWRLKCGEKDDLIEDLREAMEKLNEKMAAMRADLEELRHDPTLSMSRMEISVRGRSIFEQSTLQGETSVHISSNHVMVPSGSMPVVSARPEMVDAAIMTERDEFADEISTRECATSPLRPLATAQSRPIAMVCQGTVTDPIFLALTHTVGTNTDSDAAAATNQDQVVFSKSDPF